MRIQAKRKYQYKNINEKLYRADTAIRYNKTCRLRQIPLNYILVSIMINGKSRQNINAVKAATQYP